jgi:outer membrane protein assembly factor BamB
LLPDGLLSNLAPEITLMRTKQVIELLIAAFFTIAAIWMIVVTAVQFVNPPPTPTPTLQTVSPPKQITVASLPLQEVWRWSGTIQSTDSPSLILGDHRVILAAFDRQATKVVVLDVSTGAVIWTDRYTPSEAPNNFWSLHADQKQVYVGSGGYVEAFDIETGHLLWRGGEVRSGWHGSRNVYPKANQLDVYLYTDDHILYTLDKRTGETLEVIEQPRLLFRLDGVDYEAGAHRAEIVAKDSLTHQVLWQQNLKGKRLQLWPIVANDTLYLAAGADYGVADRQIFALSTKTGQIIWQSPASFVSNIALSREMLFAIQGDATIVALDSETGKQVGQIAMQPALTYQAVGSQRKGDYLVAASDRFVAAYYKNSRELIVLQWEDETSPLNK